MGIQKENLKINNLFNFLILENTAIKSNRKNLLT